MSATHNTTDQPFPLATLDHHHNTSGTDCSRNMTSQILPAWVVSAVGLYRFLLCCITSEHFFLYVLLQTFSNHIWTSYVFAYQLTDLASDFWVYRVAYSSSLANWMCFMSCTEGKLEIVPLYCFKVFANLPIML